MSADRGPGRLTWHLADAGLRVTATDASLAMLDLVQRGAAPDAEEAPDRIFARRDRRRKVPFGLGQRLNDGHARRRIALRPQRSRSERLAPSAKLRDAAQAVT